LPEDDQNMAETCSTLLHTKKLVSDGNL